MLIAGLDEVGRGAFAGPLLAGCVAINTKPPRHIKIDDSKKLTEGEREKASKWIKENATTWGIGKASATYIDKYGITKAENKAFREAVKNAQKRKHIKIDAILIDAFFIPRLTGLPKHKQFAIKKGDSKAKTIACASIIAKVERDRLMTKLSEKLEYKNYEWQKNKGYGTLTHIKAIQKCGITKMHRKLFLRNV